MRDYFNEVQVMRAFNSGTLRGKAFPLSWKQPKQNWLIPDTEMVCESQREPLPGFGAWPGVGVIPLATFQGEVDGGGLKLPFFDVVSTGRVFYLFQAHYVLSQSKSFHPRLCFEGNKGGADKGEGEQKEPPWSWTSFFGGMKTWHSAVDTILQQNCSNKVAEIREPQASEQLNK